MSNPILYLMSKYTGREADSLKENQDAWLALNAKGYLCYSPICESHNIEEYRKTLIDVDKSWEHECGYTGFDGNNPCYPEVPESYDCDPDCPKKKVLQYKEPDYVARDLRLIEAWLKHDINIDVPEVDNPIQLYDSGVVGVVLPSAYHIIGINPTVISWDSHGAQKEYIFMQSHHILCISPETALTVPSSKWKDYGL